MLRIKSPVHRPESSSRNSVSPTKNVNALIQADIHLQVTANEGIRRTDDPQNKASQSQKRFSP